MIKLLCLAEVLFFFKYLFGSPESANDTAKWKKIAPNILMGRRKLLNLSAFLLFYILFFKLGGNIYFFFVIQSDLSESTQWGKQLCAWLYDDIWSASHPRFSLFFVATISNELANSIHKLHLAKRKLRLPGKRSQCTVQKTKALLHIVRLELREREWRKGEALKMEVRTEIRFKV